MIFSDMNTVSASPKVHPPNGTRYYTFQVCRFNIINFNQLSFFIKLYFPLINNYIVLMSNTIYMTFFFSFYSIFFLLLFRWCILHQRSKSGHKVKAFEFKGICIRLNNMTLILTWSKWHFNILSIKGIPNLCSVYNQCKRIHDDIMCYVSTAGGTTTPVSHLQLQQV